MGSSKRSPSAASAIEAMSLDEHIKQVILPAIQHMQSCRSLMQRLHEEAEAPGIEPAAEVVEAQNALKLAIVTAELQTRAIEGDLANAEPTSESVN